MFLDYLTDSATLTAVVLPAVLAMVFLGRDFMQNRLPALKVILSAIALLVPSYLLSYWDSSGFHVFSAFLVSLVVWAPRKEITAGSAFAIVYLSTLVIDLLGSKTAYPTMSSWYTGIGGAGAADLLLILPILGFAAVKGLQIYTSCRTPQIVPVLSAT